MYSLTNALVEWFVLCVLGALTIFGVVRGWSLARDPSKSPRHRLFGALTIAVAIVLPFGTLLVFACAWGP